MEIETIKKSQREITTELENVGKKSGVTDASITNRIQEIEERISSMKDTVEDIDITVKKNAKCKIQKAPISKNIGKPRHNKKNKPKINRYRREQKFPTQRASKHLQKIIEENFPNLKRCQ
jgi:hypothetical protein